ncbi:F-box-like/WD repeat-containing protein TBL1XR1-B, partial [Smittium culicis]
MDLTSDELNYLVYRYLRESDEESGKPHKSDFHRSKSHKNKPEIEHSDFNKTHDTIHKQPSNRKPNSDSSNKPPSNVADPLVNSTKASAHEEEDLNMAIDVENNDHDSEPEKKTNAFLNDSSKNQSKPNVNNSDSVDISRNANSDNPDTDLIDIDVVKNPTNSSSISSKRHEPESPFTKEISKKKRPKMFGNIIGLTGHNGSAFVGAWNPVFPNTLATGAGDGTARIWLLKSSDQKLIKGNSYDEEPIVLMHNSDKPTNEDQVKDVMTLAWSSDGTMLATGCFDGFSRIWSIKGELISSFENNGAPNVCLKWSPTSKYLLAGSLNGVAILWDVKSSKIVSKFESHKGAILDVAWYNNNIFATCSSDTTIYVWSTKSPKTPLFHLVGHESDINCISWHLSGDFLASASDDGTSKVWELPSDTFNVLEVDDLPDNEGDEMTKSKEKSRVTE